MSYPCPHCGIDTALAFPGPADEVVIDGKRWRVIPSGFGYDDGSQSCRLVPIEGQVDAAERVQPPPHLTPEEVQEIRDWIATPPTSHVDDLIYRALRELSEITEEVRTLRLLVAVNEASRIPDGHTRIDGKLFRLERHGDLNRYGLVRVRPEENPDV